MDRTNWIDAAKGLAITLVVIGHTLRGVKNSEIDLPDLGWLDEAIYTFHMPLFMVLAGWFFVASIANRSFGTYAKGKVQRILYPMILWTYLFLGTKLLAGQFVNSPVGLSDFLILPIPGVLHFWFLWDLFLLCLVFFPLRYVLDGHRLRPHVWVGLALGSFFLVHLPMSDAAEHWFGSAIRYAPFFLLGAGLGQYDWAEAPRPRWGVCALAVFAVTITISGWFGLAGRLSALVLLMSCLCAVAHLYAVLPRGVQNALRLFGTASMTIYLGHTIFSAALREVLLAGGWQGYGLHLIAGICVGLVAPLAMLAIARRFGVAQALGLEKGQTKAINRRRGPLFQQRRPLT